MVLISSLTCDKHGEGALGEQGLILLGDGDINHLAGSAIVADLSSDG